MVWDDPKLQVDNGKVLKPNKVVGGSIPSRKIVLLLHKKTSKVVKYFL